MNTTRRTFIKNSGIAMLTLAFMSPWRQLLANPAKETSLPKWEELVETARWCPTVHNLQPHQLKIISDTEAELYFDPTRLLPVGDPGSIFSTMAMGIFVEHLSIVAFVKGYEVILTEFSNPISIHAKGSTLFGKLKLIPTKKKTNYDVHLIKKRRTSRMPYNGTPLKKSSLDRLQEQAQHFQFDFQYSSDQEVIEVVKELNQKTLFEDLESKANREELDNLFRYTEEDAETKKDGLWAKCMGFSGKLMKSVFQHHERWTKGMRKKMLAKKYSSSFDGTSSLCWISGKFTSTEEQFNAGIFFAKHWLQLTKEGAYLQPVGSLITNKGAYQELKKTLTTSSNGEEIFIAYRAGYSDEPTRSYRLDTNEIIL